MIDRDREIEIEIDRHIERASKYYQEITYNMSFDTGLASADVQKAKVFQMSSKQYFIGSMKI